MTFADYPGHLVALFLALAAAGILVAAFHAGQLQTPPRRRYRRLLAAMHYTVILALLAILWNPSAWQEKQIFDRNAVLAIFDTSESMSVTEEGRVGRLERSLSKFEECFDARGESGPGYRVYGVDDRAYHCGSADLLRRWGSRSNLHEGFALIAETPTENAPSGAVVFTDGRAEDRDPRRYLPPRDEVPVLIVGVGSRTARPDIAIAAINCPPTAWVDSAYDVGVVVNAARTPDGPVTLELVCDDEVIETRQLRPEQFKTRESAPAEAAIDFTVPAGELGVHVLTARVKPCRGEINLANNVRSAAVEVTHERSLRVLLYTQWASFDIGKIRQALAWDKRFRVDLGFDVIRDTGLAARASQASGSLTLSDISERYDEYDVIILGSCEVGLAGEEMYDFIAKRGGGLILLPGNTAESLATPESGHISAALPILFGGSWRGRPGLALLEDEEWIGTRAREQNALTTKERGQDALVTQGRDALATLGVPIRRWPPLREQIKLTFESQVGRVFDPAVFADSTWRVAPYYEIADVKPAATALATAGDVPIAAVQRLGRGRVCLLNASKLFMLYREDRQGGALSELMCGLVAHLGRTPAQGAGVELFSERTPDDPQRLAFNAYVVDEAFEPVVAANVLLTVGERVARMEPVGRGYYRATLDWGSGQSVVATVQAERNGSFLGERRLATNLPPVRDEMSCVDLDEPFLRALAERVGARYVHLDDLDEDAARLFVPRRQIGVTETVNSVWPRWPLLVVLCLLLSAGWFIRRAIGLV